MLLHGTNDDILIPHPSLLGMYKDEKKKFLQRDNFFLRVGTKPKKTDKTVVQVSP